jgi:hypothetical protein
MRSLVNYLARRAKDLGVDVRTDTEATAQGVLALDPEVVVLATWSRYRPDGSSGFSIPPIAGWDQDFVVGPEQVIRGPVRPTGTVVVLDDEGMHAAAGVAELLATGGAQVHYITRHLAVTPNLEIAIPYVARRLHDSGVEVHTLHYLEHIGDHAATIYDIASREERTIDRLDNVVLATMREPIDELYEPLRRELEYVYLVGDALAPRTLREATYEGNRFARVIGEPNMPASVEDELFHPDPNLVRPASVAPPGAGLESTPATSRAEIRVGPESAI